jgi:hypothetical protein
VWILKLNSGCPVGSFSLSQIPRLRVPGSHRQIVGRILHCGSHAFDQELIPLRRREFLSQLVAIIKRGEFWLRLSKFEPGSLSLLDDRLVGHMGNFTDLDGHLPCLCQLNDVVDESGVRSGREGTSAIQKLEVGSLIRTCSMNCMSRHEFFGVVYQGVDLPLAGQPPPGFGSVRASIRMWSSWSRTDFENALDHPG